MATCVERRHKTLEEFRDGFGLVIQEDLGKDYQESLPCDFILKFDEYVVSIIQVDLEEGSGMIVERYFEWNAPYGEQPDVRWMKIA